MTVFQTFLDSDDVDSFEGTGQVFYRISFNWDLLDNFLTIRLALWVLGRKTREVKCHSHYIISRIHTINIPYHC